MKWVVPWLVTAHLTEPHFSGRDQELKLLQNHLELAAQGKGAMIFISGEAGVGKTRLVNEFLTLAEKEAEIVSGYCLSRAALPYFPFIEAFSASSTSANQDKSRHNGSDLLGIKGWLKGTESTETDQLGIRVWLTGPRHARKIQQPSLLSPEMRKNMTYIAVTEKLVSMSTKSPIILFLDDLQWGDSASLSLMHYISRAIVSSRVLIIGTFRSEELSPDSEGHPHPLVETLRLMSREDLYIEIKLPRLREPEIAELAESMVGGTIDDHLIEKLAKESQGNPLFAVESLRLLAESGCLIQENGEWRLSVDKPAIPNKVRDIIMRRLDMLDSTQRRLLDIASVAGDKIDPAILGGVLSMDRLLVLENLHRISRSALLINPSDSAYRFGHAKLREVLYEELSSPLKREYHARVAEMMENEADGKDEFSVNELAFHYAQAGNKEKSIKYSLLAGEDARKRFSNAEAIDYFSYVLSILPDDAVHFDQKILAQEGLGDAYYAVGSFEKAKKTFEKLGETTRLGGVRVRALRKAMAASFQRGDMPHMVELAGRAEKDVGCDRLEDARVQVYKAQAIGFRGKLEEATHDLEGCLQVFQNENSLLDVATVSREISEFYSCQGQVAEALSAIHRSIELCTDLKDPYGQAIALFYEGLVYFNCGRNEEALTSYSKAVEIGGKVGDYATMARSTVYSGMVHESLGELREALACSLKAVEYAEKTDSYYTQLIGYANVTRNYAKLGNRDPMEEYYAKFTRLFTEVGHTASRLAHAGSVRTQAAFFAAKGQWSEANKYFEDCLSLYKGAMWANLHEAMARTEYALILAKQGKNAEAKAHIEEASRLYARIGNDLQIARLNRLLEEVSGNKLSDPFHT